MILRRAVDQLRQRRLLKRAVRAALAITLVTSAPNLGHAQQVSGVQLPTMPIPQGSAQGTAIVLPALPSMGRTRQQSTPRKLLNLVGLRRTAQKTEVPETHPVPGAQVVVWTANKPVASDAGLPQVVAAAATLPAPVEVPSAPKAPEIALTIGSTDLDAAFTDIDIPLMLPSYSEPVKTALPKSPSADSNRKPEIVLSGNKVRLSTPPVSVPPKKVIQVAKSPARASTLPASSRRKQPELVAQSGQRVTLGQSKNQASSAAHFSLSDSSKSMLKPGQITAKADPVKPQIAKPAVPDQLPSLAGQASPAVDPTRPLPSTSSRRSRPGALARAVGMRVQIEGESPTNLPSHITIAPEGGSSLPRPTFELKPESSLQRLAQPSTARPNKPIQASMASSVRALPKKISDSASQTSSRRRPAAMPRMLPSRQTPHLDISNAAKQLQLVATQTMSIQSAGVIQQATVEAPEICSLIPDGEKSFSLKGLKPGTTRVAVVTSTASGQPKVQVYQVSVGKGNDGKGQVSELARSLDATVLKLYSDSSVRVSTDNESLIVAGYAASEDEAKRILSLVRRTSLMPVIDRLQVRR